MRIKALMTVGALALVAGLTGCGSAATGAAPHTIAIEMTNYKLSPAQVSVKPGEKVQFSLHNGSDQDHEYESEAGKFEEMKVPAGTTRTAPWTAPTEAGDYEFMCDIPGHEGMKMTVTVTK